MEVPLLHHTIGFEEKKFSARPFHRGAIVTNARHGATAAHSGAQTGNDGIFAMVAHIK